MVFVPEKSNYKSITLASEFIKHDNYNVTIPKVAVLIYDSSIFKRIVKIKKAKAIKFYYTSKVKDEFIFIHGFGIGASAVCTLIEILNAYDVNEIRTIGFAAGINTISGDIIHATSAIADDGVSPHYIDNNKIIEMNKVVNDCAFGLVWSTSAIFRETSEEIVKFKNMNVLAVDMETAGVFSICQYYNLKCRVILVINDELTAEKWIFHKPPSKNIIDKAVGFLFQE